MPRTVTACLIAPRPSANATTRPGPAPTSVSSSAASFRARGRPTASRRPIGNRPPIAAPPRRGHRPAIAGMWGGDWRECVRGTDDDVRRRRDAFLKAWDEGQKVVTSGDSKAMIEVGKSGWTLPIPIVKDGSEWRFDVAAGIKEMVLRRIGHDEASVVQTLLAIVDAQSDYAALDPMNTGAPAYARRLLSSPGRKDGRYWETKPGEPP